MSVAWQSNKSSLEYWRKMGIEVNDEEENLESPALLASLAWLLFWLVLGGGALYGALLAAGWALRALGVVVKGI
jgi:hypothetical protein